MAVKRPGITTNFGCAINLASKPFMQGIASFYGGKRFIWIALVAIFVSACAGDDEEVADEAIGPQLFDDKPTDLGIPAGNPVVGTPTSAPNPAPTATPSLTPTMVEVSVANLATYRLKNKATDSFVRPAQCSMQSGTSLVITTDPDTAQDSCSVFEFVPSEENASAYYIKSTASQHYLAPKNCSDVSDDSVGIEQISPNQDLSCALWSVEPIANQPDFFRLRNVAHQSFIRSQNCSGTQDDTVEIKQVDDSYTGECTMWAIENVTASFSDLLDTLAVQGVNLAQPVVPTMVPTTVPLPNPTPTSAPTAVPTPLPGLACKEVAERFAPAMAVINQNCAGCHVGENSFGGNFLLDGSGDSADLIAFDATAKSVNNFEQSLLLTKPLGGDGHGGGAVLANTDAAFATLLNYVNDLSSCTGPLVDGTPRVIPTPFVTATPRPTPIPTARPTLRPTPVPTARPTATPTAVPTATPTAGPTAQPTVAATARPKRFCDQVEEEFLLTAYPVLEAECQNCHVGPNASSGRLNLTNGGNSSDFDVFELIAKELVDGQSKLLLKPLNEIPHGPGQRLTRDSANFMALDDYVTDLLACETRIVATPTPEPQKDLGIRYPSAYSELHKTTMLLASRLPTDAEINSVTGATSDAQRTQRLGTVVDQLMTEQYFYDGLKHAFNDLILTDNKTWNEAPAANVFFGPLNGSFDRSSEPAQERGAKKATYGIARAPLELVEHVVRNNRPFTEILTANYVMVNPHAARLYGIQFDDADFMASDDGDDFRPAYQLSDDEGQSYNFAGILSTAAFLDRYPTSFTNRNRARAKYVYDYFLDFDVEASFDRNTLDLDNVIGHVPTSEDPQCTSCHDIVDPVAGLFKNWTDRGRFVPNDNWFSKRNTRTVPQMLELGFVPEITAGTARESVIPLVNQDDANPISWLADQVASDPRFATKMTKHTFEWLTGINPNNSAVISFIADQANTFKNNGYNYKQLVKAIVLSDYVRVSTIGADEDPNNFAIFGKRRMLSPEALRLKILAVTGTDWVSPNTRKVIDSNDYKLLYGGIDSQGVTVRQTERNRTMAALQERIAQQLACEITAGQLRASSGLFEGISVQDFPGDNQGGVDKIKQHLRTLLRKVTGSEHGIDSIEVTAAYDLFNDVRSRASTTVMSGCRSDGAAEDPNKVITPWMSVLAYLLLDETFFYH